ncbi:hypothetical protein FBU31_001682 [Coemansia sp. 'formosensis']|nr:hypothetical protein FBU31_001682 [Coemansia sp. 'formosensis']
MCQGPSKRLRRSSFESQIQPQATSDGELGAPSESSTAAAITRAPRDTIPSEPPQTPNHGMPPWVQAGVTRSPSSVTGNQLQANGDFGCIARNNGLIVDKTRLCKALFDCNAKVVCVCLPRRFGKTFNLSIVEEFFNVITNNDIKPVDGSIDTEAGRAERMKLFEKSLLLTTESEFFNEHFFRYPVIRINFKVSTNQITKSEWSLLLSIIPDAANNMLWLENKCEI